MKQFIIDLFELEKKPVKGLMAYEWVIMAYLVLTLIVIFSMYTTISNPQVIIFGRLRIAALTTAMWVVCRLAPCRATHLLRAGVRLGLLAWWYPDTLKINRHLPNLDHLFAQWEQDLFDCQPVLPFSEALPGHPFSELFDMGYATYYPMIAATAVYCSGWYYKKFNRTTFVILSSFFIYYIILILVPVTGPTFYYKAIGLQNVTAGIFPNVHDYFNHHQGCLPSSGYTDGIFYHLVKDAKAADERPIAAFPNSHVSVSAICMLLLWHDRSYKLLAIPASFYLLLCCAIVYIQTHYPIDVIAGFITAVILFTILLHISHKTIMA